MDSRHTGDLHRTTDAPSVSNFRENLRPTFSSRLLRLLSARFRRPRLGDLIAISVTLSTGLLFLILAAYFLSTLAIAMPLSAGDRVSIVVASGEDFTGRYQLDVQGHLHLPHVGRVDLSGLEPEAAAAAISDRLVQANVFKSSFVRTSLSVIFWAPLHVMVSGAVFYPGAHRINLPPSRDRAPEKQEELPGAALPERRLSDALRTAGGVTPWADVAHVVVKRKGVSHLYDLWGVVRGEANFDPALQAGDEILVPSQILPQAALARPTAITPPGVKVFISNLIQPAQSNAQATAANGSISMLYGSRFSQAVVAGNCVGGIFPTSSERAAVLVRTDRQSGATSTIDMPIERLIRSPLDETNPILLEGDAVACYDSKVTGVRDVFRALSDLLSPISILLRGVRL